ncbi:hypothetical protein IT413_02030 [Candidatus Peregrinibacteria bacterium]|nr:hypothetical protein [Candidatus Peregrinibacteria bacterium]
MSSAETEQSLELPSFKTIDLFDSLEIKVQAKYPNPDRPFGEKRTDPLPNMNIMTVARAIAKRLPNMALQDLDNYKHWISQLQEATQNKEELVEFIHMAIDDTMEIKRRQSDTSQETSDIINPS